MRAVTDATVPANVLPTVLAPRDGFVVEREVEPGRYEAIGGPVRDYRRSVDVTDLDDDDARVRQVVEFRLAIPYWGWLFARPVRAEMSRLVPRSSEPWWAPPQALDGPGAVTLACLGMLSVAAGFLSILLGQTLTFAADEFGADTGAQGLALALVRADVVIALVLVAAADRRGRRWALLAATTASATLTVLGALAPSLHWLTATQVAARGCTSAMVIIIAIVAAEDMPAGSRAYAVSILAMAGAVGAGIPILLLFVADLHPSGWRVLFAMSVLVLPLVRSVSRRLTESRRFGRPHVEAPVAGHGPRFWLLAASGFLFAIFFIPASQFTNEFLREERGFSAARMSLFTVLTNLPGAIGIVVGGHLADVRGRRLVGAVATLVGVGASVMMFLVVGWPLWAWSVVGSLVGAASVPALGVYGPELFPTSLRGRANGVITGLSRAGGVLGLVAVGFLVNTVGGLGPALAVLALGPLAVALLILIAYPETAHRELEELNPEDAGSAEDLRRVG